MSQLLAHLVDVPVPILLAAVGLLVFAEAAVFVGFVLPGETAVLLGGFVAATGRMSVVLLAVVVVAAAVVGDSVGYQVGKKLGPRVLGWRIVARHAARVDSARGFLDGRGASAVFLGRFTAFLRAMVPGLAGLAGMRYRKFLFYNALGGLVWGVGCVAAGYAAGASYEQVAAWLGRAGAVTIVGVVLVVLVVWRVRRGRRAARDERVADPVP